MCRFWEKSVGDIWIQIFLFLAGSVKYGSKSNLRRSIDQAGIGKKALVKKLVDSFPQTIRVLHLATSFDVDEKAFYRAEWIVHGEIVVKLLHKKQLVAKYDFLHFVPIALDIRYKLMQRDVKFFNFWREIYTSCPKTKNI